MGNIDLPFVLLEMREVQAAARTLGLEAETFEIRRAQDIGPASTPSNIALKDFISPVKRSKTPTGSASTSLPWARDYQRCGRSRNSPKREGSCPMDRTSQICG